MFFSVPSSKPEMEKALIPKEVWGMGVCPLGTLHIFQFRASCAAGTKAERKECGFYCHLMSDPVLSFDTIKMAVGPRASYANQLQQCIPKYESCYHEYSTVTPLFMW